MKKLTSYTLICLLLLLPLYFYSQPNAGASITGVVLDKDTKQPVIGALVSIVGKQIGTATDSLGVFTIKNISTGTYLVEIRAIGYEVKTITDINVLTQKATKLIIEIQEIPGVLDEVQVVAFRFENDRLKPVSLYSFSREEINLNPGAQGDIFRAIGMLPGVSSSGGIYSAIAVRGQGVRDNVYFVDDIPITEVGHLEGNSFFNDPNGGRFSIFAPRVIDYAEFQGGGFGPEYGRRSASYLGLGIKEGNAENPIIDGQLDLLGLTINYDGPSKINKKTSVFFSARYQNFYGLVNLIGLKDIGLPIYSDFVLKTTTKINKNNKLSLIAILSPESYKRTIDNVYQDKNLNLLYLPNFKRNKTLAGLNLRTLIGKKSYWQNIVYYTKYTSDIEVGKAFAIADAAGNIDRNSIGYKNNIQSQDYLEEKIGMRSLYTSSTSKKNKIVVGIEADRLLLHNTRRQNEPDTQYIFRRAELFNDSLNYLVITPNLINSNFIGVGYNFSAFINYSFTVFKRGTINTGVRYDYSGFSKQMGVSPRVSGSYVFNEKNTFSLGAGIYYQDPVYIDIADQRGNTLKLEEVGQLILGYKRFFEKDLKLTVEVWGKTFENLIVTPINGTVERNNRGSGRAKGIDINITKRLVKKIHGQLGYSYIECKRNDQDGIGEYDFMFSQPHQFNALLSFKYTKTWSFSFKYRYATGRPSDNYIIHNNVLNNPANFRYSKELIGRNRNRLPNFSSLDVRVNYRFEVKKFVFTSFIDIVNVLNRPISNSENFNSLSGKNYYEGISIFPTGGLKFEF